MKDRKELIKQYKQTVQPAGIYMIKCLINNKIFIGSSKNLPGKINSCRFQLGIGSHMNKALQKDFNEFGASNFTFESIDYLEIKKDKDYDCTEDLLALEGMWLEKLQPYGEKGYNKRSDPVL